MIDRAEGDTDRGIGAMTNRNQMKGRERPQREDISKYIISFALQMSPSASVEQPWRDNRLQMCLRSLEMLDSIS